MSHRSISLVNNLSRIRPVMVIHSNVTNAVQQMMEAMHTPVYFETYDIKGNMNRFPQEVVDSIRKNKVCLNGRLKTSLYGGVARKELDLFASLVNCFKLNGQPSRHKNVNIVVIRENTDAEYREHEVVPGVIRSFQMTTTKFWLDRIAKYAFEFAQLNKRKKVTAVHSKGTKLADAFFLESCQEAAKMYPIIAYDEISVDSCCLQLVEKPERFDVAVTPNLYGNLIANIAAGVAGGGNGDNSMPGGSFGGEYAVFEQVGSVRNNENPVALMFSSVMMLRHLQHLLFADRLETAVKRYISEVNCGNSNTTTTTQEVVDAVIANLD